ADRQLFTRSFSELAIAELEDAATAESDGSVENMQINLAKIPALAREVADFRRSALEEGYGLGRLTGFQASLSGASQRRAYWLIANLLGTAIPQNAKGDLLIEVQDRGASLKQGGRYHQTRDGGSLHTDSPQWAEVPDYIGLLCVNIAKHGGE